MKKLVFFAVAILSFWLFGCSENLDQPDDDKSSSHDVSSSSLDDASSSSLEIKIPINSIDLPSSSVDIPMPFGMYLGYGYDVIKSAYVNREEIKLEVLNLKEMVQDGIAISEPRSLQEFEITTGSSLRNFYENKTHSISSSNNLNVLVFSGNFSKEFNVSATRGWIDTSFYASWFSKRYTRGDYIENASPASLSKYVNESFVSDLQSLTASEIFDKYGTHIFISYFKGGSLEFFYNYVGKEITSESELRTATINSFSVNVGDNTIGTNKNDNATVSRKYRSLDNESNLFLFARGGDAINATTLQNLTNDYSKWANSIEGKEEICGIGNFDNSFIPIWGLVKSMGGFSGKADSLEMEFYSRAAMQRSALMTRTMKTEIKEYSASGTHIYISTRASKDVPAFVEIYALGAGGGGQGGDNNDGCLSDEFGTGGSGGGGAAAYLKLRAEEGFLLYVTVGDGGAGGDYYTSGCGGTVHSGHRGTNGGTTSVKWNTKNIVVSAGGGIGGGGEGKTSTVGGAGGKADINPPYSGLYLEKDLQDGYDGTNGDYKGNVYINGGNAATINLGSLAPFGGGLGAIRDKDVTLKEARLGGGGTSQHKKGKGTDGGNGLVIIKTVYFSPND